MSNNTIKINLVGNAGLTV